MIVVDVINLPSSANTLLRDRVLALRRRGIDNRIVCMNGPGLDGLRALGIPVHVVDFPRGLDPWRLLVSLLRLVRHLRAVRADVVHTHCSVPGAVGRVAAWLAGVPVVVHTVHGFHFHEDMPALRRAPWLLAEKALGLLTDTLLTQNRGDLALAERHGIGPRGRRGRIGNGIDLERFRRAGPRPATGGVPVVTCVARFEPVKNHALLLEMTARVVRAGTPLVLRLVGTGELEGQLRARAEALGIAGVVEFLGYREDIPRILAGSDVAVLTSLKEGMPRAVLEAMAMELPVVATRVPGTREAIRHGYTGFALPPEDVAGLAGALGQLLRDPGLRVAMGERARRVAEAEFDERPIAESLRTLYAARLRAKRPAERPARAARTPEPLHERLGSSSRTAR